jgi:hypothetical protein
LTTIYCREIDRESLYLDDSTYLQRISRHILLIEFSVQQIDRKYLYWDDSTYPLGISRHILWLQLLLRNKSRTSSFRWLDLSSEDKSTYPQNWIFVGEIDRESLYLDDSTYLQRMSRHILWIEFSVQQIDHKYLYWDKSTYPLAAVYCWEINRERLH